MKRLDKMICSEDETTNEVKLVGVDVDAVLILVAGRERRLPWLQLLQAARNDATACAAYGLILSAALPVRRRLILEQAWERAKACSGHLSSSEVVRGFTGPVARDQNPAAHGNIEVTDVCRCGARRRTLINGLHIEEGAWHVDEALLSS